ncbi:MAG: AMP-binding protein, partial [Acidimicrobiia bacterium]|nr:AMP-binding protein [Acidimicrobiia bacterium]
MTVREPSVQELSAVFLGEESLVVSCGEAWLAAGHEIRAVASDVDEIVQWAEDRGLPTVGPERILDGLTALPGFDYLFSIVNFQLLPREVLALPRSLPINYHDSPLPRYAGVNATNWAILNGEKEHAVTWHVMVEEVDAGAILEQRFFPIRPDDTALTLNARAYEEALEGFKRLTDRLGTGAADLRSQADEGRSYYARWQRPRAGGVIDWTRPAAEIDRLVRGLDFGSYANPLGRAKVILGQEAIAVQAVRVSTTDTDLPPGTLVNVADTEFIVAVPDGTVAVRATETLTGDPITPGQAVADAGLAVGDRLPVPAPDVVDELTELAGTTARHEQYWIDRHLDLEPLPAPYARTRRGRALRYELTRVGVPAAFQQAMNERGLDSDSTLAACVILYLSRINDRVDYDIGFRSAATRVPSAAETLFASYLPLRISATGQESLLDLIDLLRPAQREIERRGPFATDLLGRTPTLREVTGSIPLAIEVGNETDRPPRPGPELVIRIAPDGDELLVFSVEGAYQAVDLDRLADQLGVVLADLADGMSTGMGHVRTLPSTELDLLRAACGADSAEYQIARSLAEAFERQAAETPDGVAVTFRDASLSYADLNRRSNQVAHALIERGAGPDVLIGLAMRRSLDLLVGILAILKSGAAYLPLDPNYPPDRIRYMVEHAGAPIVLTQQEVADSLPAGSGSVLCIGEIDDRGDSENPAAATDPDSLAYVMYTSGSTGKPKGVEIPHRNVLRLMAATEPWFGFTPADVWTLFHSYAFDFTVWEIWGALLYGGRLVIPEHDVTRSPRAFLQLLESEAVTVLNQTPSAFRQLIDADEALAGEAELALRYVIFGGEALDLTDLR